MTTKVKGIFKGINKHISNIFDEKEAEDEIEIGFPTDVKHVAHIGLDGPTANQPTWMTTMKSASEAPEVSPAPATAPNSTETNQGNNTKGDGHRIPRSKPSKDASNSDGSKNSRHHRSSDPSSDSSNRSSSRPTRRHRSANHAGESPSEETAEGAVAAPKQHRRRKSKAANGDGPEKSSRRWSKESALTDISPSDVESTDGSKRGESPACGEK